MTAGCFHISVLACGKYAHKNFGFDNFPGLFVGDVKLLPGIVNIDFVACFMGQLSAGVYFFLPAVQVFVKLSGAIATGVFLQVLFPEELTGTARLL